MNFIVIFFIWFTVSKIICIPLHKNREKRQNNNEKIKINQNMVKKNKVINLFIFQEKT